MPTASRTPASEARDPWGRRILAAAALILLIGAAHRTLSRRAPPPAPAASARAATPEGRPPRPVSIAMAPTNATAMAAPSRSAPLPGSLQGTDEDGALRVDENGNLIVGPEILVLFDYYLSATGEESQDAIRARIVAAIERRLPAGRARAEAISILDHYIAYRADSKSLRAAGDDLSARLEALGQLRRRHFGDLAEELFGAEERAHAVAVEQRKVLQDSSLSAEERGEKLAALERQMPEETRRAREEAVRPLRLRADEEAMRAEGATDEEIQRRRVEALGPEAAERLGALDRKRAEWKRRLAEFRDKRAEIQRDEPDPGRQKAAIERLLEASFTAMERIRVEAADKMDAP
jgi:lipase chaperone LimK